jgi:actin-like protein 6A
VQETDDVTAILTFIFMHGLRIDPAETPILLGESVFMNKVSREKIIDILFTKFKVPAIYVAKNHVLAG